MERQAGGVGVSHRGGSGGDRRNRVDSPVSSPLPAVVVPLRRRTGRGQTGPHTGAAVGPTDHTGGGAALA